MPAMQAPARSRTATLDAESYRPRRRPRRLFAHGGTGHPVDRTARRPARDIPVTPRRQRPEAIMHSVHEAAAGLMQRDPVAIRCPCKRAAGMRGSTRRSFCAF